MRLTDSDVVLLDGETQVNRQEEFFNTPLMAPVVQNMDYFS